MSLKIAIIQHSEGTPPGSVSNWVKFRDHRLKLHRLFCGEELPALDRFDLAVVLGGPMNVNDTHLHPWLADEKIWLRSLIDAGKPCLGICLGGQLLAQALGAEVRQHTDWEIGWHPVDFKPVYGSWAHGIPVYENKHSSLTVFQWHHDTFELPVGACLLASNSITPNQAFIFGDRIVGVQFHPEATEVWVRDCANENSIPHGRHVQTPTQLLEGVHHIPSMRGWMFEILDQLAATVKHP